MKKRNIPRHVGEKFTFFYLDIWGVVFMLFPCILFISSVIKFRSILVLIINILILAISYVLIAENPQLRQRGIEIFVKFLKYEYLGDRYLENEKLDISRKDEIHVSKTKITE